MLHVLTGPPGAGKSTLAGLVADRLERSVLVPGDRFLGFVRSGYVVPWSDGAGAQNAAAWDASMVAVRPYLDAGYDVVYDGTVDVGSLARVRELSGAASLSYVVLLPPLAVCLRRVAGREDHGFDDPAATAAMHARFTAAATDVRHVVAGLAEPGAIATDVLAGRFVTSRD